VSEREVEEKFGKYGKILKIDLKNGYGFTVSIIGDVDLIFDRILRMTETLVMQSTT
jgi:hypothetical protein